MQRRSRAERSKQWRSQAKQRHMCEGAAKQKRTEQKAKPAERSNGYSVPKPHRTMAQPSD